MRSPIFAMGLVAILLPVSALGADRESTDPMTLGLEEAVRADRVIWPVFVRATRNVREGHCEALGPEDLVVRENGRPVKVTAFDRERRPMIHAIVLDVSMSMVGRLGTILDAAVRYVESLGADPSEDRGVVLTFDEKLVLRAPLTGLDTPESIEAVVEAIRRIPVGTWTYLEDALYQLDLYLGSFAERSVVILLSDGKSVARLAARNAQFEYVGAQDLVTVFSVGIDLPRGKPTGYLTSLAESTGGRHYEVQNIYQAAKAFRKIQATVARRAYVTYVPTHPADGAAIEVTIRSRDPGCRILYPPVRSTRTDDLMLLQGRNDLENVHAESDPEGDVSRIRIAMDDLVAEDVMDEKAGGASEPPPRKAVVRREATLILPSEGAEDLPATLDELMLSWLRRDEGTPRESTIDATTWMEVRMQLAQVLLSLEPRFREIGRQRMEEAIRRDLERALVEEIPPDVFEAWTESGTVTAEQARKRWETVRADVLAAAFEARLENPTLADRKRQLIPFVGWLGDEHARDLAFRVETRASNLMLAGEIPAAFWRARWHLVPEWLPDDQNVVPLWLFHDPESDSHGFYRIVYPQPWLSSGDRTAPISRRPYGLLVLDRLLGSTSDATERTWRVAKTWHHPYPMESIPTKRRKQLESRKKTLRRVIVEFTPETRDAAGEAEILDVLVAIDANQAWRIHCAFEAPQGLDRQELPDCPFRPRTIR